MTKSFFSRLSDRSEAINSLLCVGLDPHASELPEPTASAAERFCMDIILATSQYAAAYKVNSAFFEVFGAEGWAVMERIVAYLKARDIPVIVDCKRGDIGTTAEAYATAFFHKVGADCVTVNPFMGRDSVEPFLSLGAVFLLCKTSNKGSNDFQVFESEDGTKLYQKIGKLFCTEENKEKVGLVVGATDIDVLADIKRRHENFWVLAPGLGSQGADLDAAVRCAGSGKILLPISRGISKNREYEKNAKAFMDAINLARVSCSSDY